METPDIVEEIVKRTGEMKGFEKPSMSARAVRMASIIKNESGLPFNSQALLGELMSALIGEKIDVGNGHGEQVEYRIGGMVVLVNDMYATSYPKNVPLMLVDTEGRAITSKGIRGNYLPLKPVFGDVRRATREEIDLWVREADREVVEKALKG